MSTINPNPTFKPRPCAVCEAIIVWHPWPTCGAEKCREEYRRRYLTGYKRDQRTVNRQAGKCRECGGNHWKDHVLCRNCCLIYEAARFIRRGRERDARKRIQAALNIANARAARAAVNDERVRRGLPVSFSTNPQLRKDLPPPAEG